MPKESTTKKQLLLELEDLRARLNEAEETLRAIRSGEVDALVVSGVDSEQVFALEGAERSYRILVENMNDGALTVMADGLILYANRNFAKMLKMPLEKVIGATIYTWIASVDQNILQSMLTKGANQQSRYQLAFTADDGTQAQVDLSVSRLPTIAEFDTFCLVATDLTEQKRVDAIVASEKLTQELLAASKKSNLELLSSIEERKRAEEEAKASEKKYREAVENASELIATMGMDRRFKMANPVTQKITGYSLEELNQLTYLDLVLPDHRERVQQHYLKQIVEKTPTSFIEFPFLSKRGEVVWVGQSASIMLDGQNVVGFQLVARDITERKRAEEVIHTSEEKFRALFENMAAGCCLNEIVYEDGKAVDYRILDVNPAYERILGINRDQVAGRLATEVYGNKEVPFLDAYAKVAETRVPISFENYYPSFKKYLATTTSSPAPGRFSNIFTDITERKLAEEELEWSYNTQNSINSILRLSVKNISLTECFNHSLNLLLSLPWLALESKGCIFLSQGTPAVLALETQVGLSEPILNKCARVAYGKCLCGKAALTGKTIYANCLNVDHEIHYDGILDHGHYCVPIISDGKTLGVINLYLKEGHKNSPREREFLTAIANVLAGIIRRRQTEEALRGSENQLSNALLIARLGHWEYDVPKDLFTFNDEFYTIFRTTVEQEGGYTMSSAEYARRFVHPDDAPMVGEAVEKAIESEDPEFSLKLEHRIIYTDGGVGYITVRFFIAKDENNRTVRTYGVNQDITERKLAEETIRESEERYRSLIEGSFDMVQGVSPDGKFNMVNKAWLEAMEYKEEELSNLTVFDVIHPDSMHHCQELFRSVINGESVKNFETVFVTKSGKTILIEGNATPRFKSGNVIGTQGFYRDITERKLTEEALRESENRFDQVAEASREIIWEVNADGLYTHISSVVNEILGYKVEEVVGKKHFYDFHPAEGRDAYKSAAFEVFNRKDVFTNLENLAQTKNGRIVTLSTNGLPILDSKGALIGYRGVDSDITERKQTEEALRKSEEKYRIIGENTADIIAITDLDLQTTFVSPSVERITGFTVEEYIAQTMDQTVTPATLKEIYRILAEEMELESTGKADPDRSRIIEMEEYCKDGSTVWLEGRYSFLRDQDLHPVGILGISRDITERKLAEKIIQESNELLQTVINTIPVRVSWKDKNLTYLGCSISFAQDSGFVKPEDIIGKDDFAMGWHKQAEQYRADDFAVMKSGKAKLHIEETQTTPSGETIHLLTSRVPLFDSERNTVGVLGAYLDITERVLMEKAVHERDERFNQLVSNLDDVVWTASADGSKLLDVNDSFERVYGVSKNEFRSNPGLWIKMVHSDDMKIAQASGEELFKTGKAMVEYRIVRPDGEIRWILDKKSLSIDEKGKPLLIGGVASDITERKLAEEALRESENRFDQVTKASGDIIWEVNADGLYTHISSIVNEILGYKVEEVIGKKYFYDFHPAEGRDAFKSAAFEVFNRKDVFTNLENLAQTKNGRIVTLSTNGLPILDGKGTLIGYRGTDSDITDRKRAEEALSKSEAEFRLLSEAMPQIVWITRKDGWNIFFNQQWVDYTGLTLEESYGHGWNTPFHPEDQRRAWDSWQKALNNNAIYSVESRLRRKDGVYKWWLVRGVPMLDVNGEILKWFGTCTDIDDIKLAEETLRKSEERYRKFFEDDLTADYLSTPEGVLLDCNPAFIKMFGFNSLEQAKANPMQSLYVNLTDRDDLMVRLQSAKKLEILKMIMRSEKRQVINIIQNAVGVFDESGKLVEIKGYMIDDTERMSLEEQFHQAQKMESVGRLAGGIAHDFNNLLTIISGHTFMAERNLDSRDPIQADLTEIKMAANRSADLTRQLLAFSRKQKLQPKVVNLNNTLTELNKMLRRMIDEDIEIIMIPNQELWNVKVDPGQIEQVIINLSINARDAMPDGGKLTIGIQNITIESKHIRIYGDVPTGRYILLTVSDTGEGMEEKVQKQIFEPFFTTKAEGKGTGLGLSTVFGIVMQSGGGIEVQSAPGAGTTFKIFLPQTNEEIYEHRSGSDNIDLPRGTETILIAEDEDVLRDLISQFLKSLGYNIIVAQNGDEALMICQELDKPVDLLITDVVMPKMGGGVLVKKLREIWTEVKVLYMSGYTAERGSESGILDSDDPFIQKPFQPDDIAWKVRRVLDGKL